MSSPFSFSAADPHRLWQATGATPSQPPAAAGASQSRPASSFQRMQGRIHAHRQREQQRQHQSDPDQQPEVVLTGYAEVIEPPQQQQRQHQSSSSTSQTMPRTSAAQAASDADAFAHAVSGLSVSQHPDQRQLYQQQQAHAPTKPKAKPGRNERRRINQQRNALQPGGSASSPSFPSAGPSAARHMSTQSQPQQSSSSSQPKSFRTQPPEPAQQRQPTTTKSVSPEQVPRSRKIPNKLPHQKGPNQQFRASLPPAPAPLPRTLQRDEQSFYAHVLEALQPLSALPLNTQIGALDAALQPSQAVQDRRKALVETLQVFIDRYYWPMRGSQNPEQSRYHVEPFGSVVLGIDNDTSDMDLVVLDRYFPHGCSDTQIKLSHLYNMRNLAAQLEKYTPLGEGADVDAIPARVPITKVKLSDGIALDINVNEALGYRNTHLLKAYFETEPYGHLLPALAKFLKFHFKNRKLNDPSGSRGAVTFSSYSLLLMLISYFQSIGALPNLQQTVPLAQWVEMSPEARAASELPRETRDIWWQRSKTRKHVVTIASFDVTHMTQPPKDWKPKPQELTLESAALGFFKHYSKFPYNDRVISIKHNGHLNRAQRYDAQTASLRREKKSRAQPAAKDVVEEDLEEDEGAALQDPEAESEIPDFEEPKDWFKEFIVTQDPFDVRRNTSHNVREPEAKLFVAECMRAADLIESGAGLAEISAMGQYPQKPLRGRRLLRTLGMEPDAHDEEEEQAIEPRLSKYKQRKARLARKQQRGQPQPSAGNEAAEL